MFNCYSSSFSPYVFLLSFSGSAGSFPGSKFTSTPNIDCITIVEFYCTKHSVISRSPVYISHMTWVAEQNGRRYDNSIDFHKFLKITSKF